MNASLRIAVLTGALLTGGRLGANDFIRGDSNEDGTINIADAIFTLSFLYGGGPTPQCLDSADLNDDGVVDVADAIFGLGILKPGPGSVIQTPPPPASFCGPDPTADNLDCSSSVCP